MSKKAGITKTRRLQIAVVGSAGKEEYPKGTFRPFNLEHLAFECGRLVAEKKAILITGGKGGIMEAACKGAKSSGGTTVGVIAQSRRGAANCYVDIELTMGFTNNVEDCWIPLIADGLIVIGGGAGTLQEITLAYRSQKPIVAFNNIPGWGEKLAGEFLDQRKRVKILPISTPEEAVTTLFKAICSLKTNRGKELAKRVVKT